MMRFIGRLSLFGHELGIIMRNRTNYKDHAQNISFDRKPANWVTQPWARNKHLYSVSTFALQEKTSSQTFGKKREKTERPENKCLQLCGIAFKDPYPKFRSKIFLSTSWFYFFIFYFSKSWIFWNQRGKTEIQNLRYAEIWMQRLTWDFFL